MKTLLEELMLYFSIFRGGCMYVTFSTGPRPQQQPPIMKFQSPNIHVASRRQPPAPHRWAHTARQREKALFGCQPLFSSTAIVLFYCHCSLLLPLFSSTAIVLFYCRRSATRTPVRPPRFERCCSHTFATARNCQ